MQNLLIKNRLKVTVLFLSLSIVLLSLQSCSSSGKTRRGKLSDAMEKASDDYEDERVVETEDEPWYEEGEEFDDYDSGEGDVSFDTLSSEISKSFKNGTAFCLMGGTGLLHRDDFYGLNNFNISYGGYFSEYHRAEFFAGFGIAPIQKTSDLDKSLKDGVFILNAGFNYKRFMTPRYTFLGQYFSFGIAINYMFWSYKNAIITQGGEEIGSDSIGGLELFTGLGVHLIQTRYFQIGGEMLPGVILWSDDTEEGFENDVFGPFWLVKFRFTLSIISK